MPPGLGGQGQPIPPVYYNTATFSPYGAGVGRGVSYASAPSLVAQGVPTFARGGEVMGYDDGGDVSDGTQVASADYTGDQGQGGYTPTPEDASYRIAGIPMGGMGGMGGSRMGGMGMRGPGMRMPRPSARSAGGMQGGFADPEGTPLYTPDGQPLNRPPNVPSDFPQINDGYGNPSYGLTAAVSSVLHFFGSALGLGPQQQGGPLPNDPMIQTNRRDFANKVPAAGVAGPAEQLFNDVDPTGHLNRELRVIGGLESVYKWHLANGDPEGAVRSAASIVMYLNSVTAEYGGKAVQSYQNGDLQGAIDNIHAASENTPNGITIEGKINPDTGNTILAKQMDLNGKTKWQGEISAPMLLAIATKIKDGSMYYNQLEEMSSRYDPQTAAMIKEKQKEQRENASAEAENQQLMQMFPQHRRQQGPLPDQPGQPKIQPIAAPAGGGGGGGDAQTAAAPTPAPVTASSEGPQPTASPIPTEQPAPTQPGATTAAPITGEHPSAPTADASGSATPRTMPTLRARGTTSPIDQVGAAPPAELPINRAGIEQEVRSKYYDKDNELLPTDDEPQQPDISNPNLTPQGRNRLITTYINQHKDWENRQKDAFKSDLSARLGDETEGARAKAANLTKIWEATKLGAAEKARELAATRTQQREIDGKLLQDSLNRGHEDRVRQETATVAAEKPIAWTDAYKEDIASGTKQSVREAAKDAVYGTKNKAGTEVTPSIVEDDPDRAANSGKLWVPKADQGTVSQAVGDIYRFSQGKIDMPDAARMAQTMLSSSYYAQPFTATYDSTDKRVHVSITDGQNVHTFVMSDGTYRDMDKLAHNIRAADMSRQVQKLHTEAQGIRGRELGRKTFEERLKQADQPRGIPMPDDSIGITGPEQ
jgi:hypothetical protein